MAELTFAFAATLDQRLQRWSRHIVDHGPGRVVDTVAERRSVLSRGYRILVMAADSGLADAALVGQLRAQGRAVIAVWDPAAPRTKEMAVRLGADAMIDADAGANEFVRVALALAGERPELAEQMAVAEPSPAIFGPPPARVPPSRDRRGGALRLVVCGPAAEEAVSVAVELARAAAGDGRRVVLADTNELSPGVAQHLGLAVLPNLRIAVDAVRDRHHRLSDTLLAVPEGGFWVLGGLAEVGQWAEITPAEVAGVIDELAEGCEVVVIQAAPVVEDLSGFGGPDRFGITRRLLADADRVVGVAAATPAGVAQLASWMADVRVVASDTPIDLALTRAPADRFRRGELTERLQADLAPASITLLPADPRLARAVWDGALVRRGPFRKAMDELAQAIVPAPSRGRTGRHRG